MADQRKGCRRTVLSTDPLVLVWQCKPEESFHRTMAEWCEREWQEHEDEMCRAEDASLFDREPEFWSYRAATDPYWPPIEVDPFEAVAEVEHA